METADKSFINIMCKPEYDAEGYKEVLITMYGKQYIVKIPVKNVKTFQTAQNKIRYRVEHTSPRKEQANRDYINVLKINPEEECKEINLIVRGNVYTVLVPCNGDIVYCKNLIGKKIRYRLDNAPYQKGSQINHTGYKASDSLNYRCAYLKRHAEIACKG